MPFNSIQAPRSAQRQHTVRSRNGDRSDPYYWLRDDARSSPQVLEHLAAENAYKDAVLAPIKPLIERVYGEIVGRIARDDDGVPTLSRGYWYWSRTRGHLEHTVYLRAPQDRFDGSWASACANTDAQVVLDANALAAGHAFFSLGSFEVSPDNRLVAFTEDCVGRQQFRLRIRDLQTQRDLEDVILGVDADIAWTEDSHSVLYIEQDPETLLGVRVRRHRLGEAVDELVYEEEDDTFGLSVSRCKSERFIFIGAESTVTSEWRYAAVDDPALSFQLVCAREREHEYQVEHLQDRLILRTNWQAQNFRIMAAPIGASANRLAWSEVIAHDDAVFIEEFDVFEKFLAIGERADGLRRIRVHPWDSPAFRLVCDEPTYALYASGNVAITSTRLRYAQTSLVAPVRTFEYDFQAGETELLKQEPIAGPFASSDYVSEFLWANARDGARIPVSVVRRRDTPIDGSAPLSLYGYGAYGLSLEPAFSVARLSLLDRGFVHAIAHVRGGQELGRAWYDNGRMLHKRRSFEDFIDVTDFLLERGYASPDKVFASGGSAGGLLVGAVLNMAPQKYRGACLHVPFLDIVTTMLDESLPLTTLEYDEWGDPREPEFYRYMLSYSPYDNIATRTYPAVLVSTGLWDSQVQYFEPAKWVARLRDHNISREPILMRVNLEAGHSGVSGRFRRFAEVAEEFGFMIELARVPQMAGAP